MKHSMAQDDSSQDRGVYSTLLYSGSDLSRHRVSLSATLVKHDKGKGPAAVAALSALSKQQKSHKDGSISPSYLCELLTAAEFFSEGAQLCSDPLVGPVQLFG